MKQNLNIKLLIIALISAYALIAQPSYSQEIGYVRVGQTVDENNILTDATNEIDYLVNWEFVAVYDPGETSLTFCLVDEESLSLVNVSIIQASEDGAAGDVVVRKGKFRIEIRNKKGEIIAKSSSFKVKDSRKI